MKVWAWVIALVAGLLAFAMPASAATIGVTYSGVLTGVDPAAGGQFAIGDTFMLNILVDNSAPDQDSAAGFGTYFGVTQFNGTFSNGYSFASTSGADYLGIIDDFVPVGDEITFLASNVSGAAVGGFSQIDAQLFFNNASGALVGSEAIPGNLASLYSLSQDRHFQLFFMDGLDMFNVNGVITGAVAITQTPIPAALPLFAAALGGLGFMGWKRRRPA
jgi:hypothetical protein